MDSLAPNDPRIEHKFVEVGGFKYHYMLAKPADKPTATVFLIHGWYDDLPLESSCGSSLEILGQILVWDGATRSLTCFP